jgi:hypothetical protein
MPESDTPARDSARDVLGDSARDVLAAEAFAVPAPDPSLTHGPVVLPDDPTGIAEPHDVLAAEEFAMPAVAKPPEGASLARRAGSAWPVALALAVLVLVWLRARHGRRARVRAIVEAVTPSS